MKLPEPAPAIVSDEAALLGWLNTATLGARFGYHAGHLALDRVHGWSALADGDREELGRVAGLALALAGEGRVLLAQRRLADGRIAYLAIRSTQPAPQKETSGCLMLLRAGLGRIADGVSRG